MKETAVYLFILVLLLFVGVNFSNKKNPIAGSFVMDAFPMCSGEIKPGRCTGSLYCKACKNCKYCAHCNNGGSCGVCGKRPSSTSRKTETEVARKYYPSKPQETYKHPTDTRASKLNETNNTPASIAKTYLVTQATSLRQYGHAQAKVLKRLQENEEVLVIERSGEYWWQVVQNGRKGWVKKHLLKEKVKRIYP